MRDSLSATIIIIILIVMSVSCSDCFSDLLCAEDSDCVFSFSGDESPTTECSSSNIDSPESIAELIEDERFFVPGVDYLESLDSSAREQSVAWILKVQAYYNFSALTAYLSVNYLDRFLYSSCFPQRKEWTWQLLSVACLSLAAKMEEPLVPLLLDLQVEGAKYVFESKTIRRMELLVLGVLDWRLRSITPFSFIAFFAWKIDSTGTYVGYLISRATHIILSNIQGSSFVKYCPSSIGAASMLFAASEIPILSLVNPEQAETWCNGLSIEKIMSCYKLMQGNMLNKRHPHLRITIRAPPNGEATSTPTSSTSYYNNKRRKLNNCLWVDDKGSSECEGN
jgi:cyclin D1/2/4